jgi:hypothetical protein
MEETNGNNNKSNRKVIAITIFTKKAIVKKYKYICSGQSKHSSS